MQEKDLKIKKDIKIELEERLKLSDPDLWNSLSIEDQEKAVNKYNYLTSIENLGIDKILEKNSNFRFNFLILWMSLLLGFFGNLFSSVLEKYLPKGYIWDIFIIVFFITLVYLFYKEINKLSAELLKESDILKRLLNKDITK